jgi:hypothetical protein
VQSLIQRSGGGAGNYLRALWAIASAVILTFFAMQIFYAPKMSLGYKIGSILVIAAIGVAGIIALLTPEPEEPVATERLYTADEVAALLAAVQSGRLVAAAAEECKFCHRPEPDATGPGGSRYHRSCFQAAYQSGKT